MRSWLSLLFGIVLPIAAQTQKNTGEAKTEATEGKEAGKSAHGRPALITTADLIDFESLPEDRRNLIENAITVARDSPWLPYKFGGTSPADGGFDCSGAMYFVMNKAGLKPPRTSADQYQWIKDAGRLREIPATVKAVDDPALSSLKPGDLLFWSGTYDATDGRPVNITHVAIYLGREKKDKRPVMINATDGRSYRGTKANGYGVYDFSLPKEGGRSKFAGYGTPPGIAPMEITSSPGSNPEAPAAR
jgi:cell wall-associated NlpC family hydrolase